MMNDYTVVIGIDAKTIQQLALTLPTWIKHKPSLFKRPWVVFYDALAIGFNDTKFIQEAVPHVQFQPWPWAYVRYEGNPNDKWTNPQRYKMLAGFVHCPAICVSTPYWLKIDVDTVANGMDDWIDPDWFENDPVIVAQKWGYTKPANQMVDLDVWTGAYLNKLPEWIWGRPPLDLIPEKGSSLVKHPRIISWCGFFHTEFTKECSSIANRICGAGQLPVPSQDGYMFYMAKRGGFGIVRTKMKGWQHRTTMNGIREAVEEAMK